MNISHETWVQLSPAIAMLAALIFGIITFFATDLYVKKHPTNDPYHDQGLRAIGAFSIPLYLMFNLVVLFFVLWI